MRKKELKLIITFQTTTDAMAMEDFCKKEKIAGRLIPVPTSIHAGCGLAWCTNTEAETEIRSVLARAGLKEEAMHKVML